MNSPRRQLGVVAFTYPPDSRSLVIGELYRRDCCGRRLMKKRGVFDCVLGGKRGQ